MHRIYIWFSFSYLTLIIYIYLEHIQSTEHLQNLKKNYLDMPPQFSGGQVNLCLI